MKTQSLCLLCVVSFLTISCQREDTNLGYEERKKLPAEVNKNATQPSPGTGTSQTDGGTRSDYKPTTGPGGQVETSPATPPSGTNPAPSNPNVTSPPNATPHRTTQP
ncbi:hypothetical protein JIN84_21690 [Luteolibacter yonseiensis]|uniref:Lipoprotein n=1 Tax=Luteolibacter yonseiensis TaxID=1144680 RepID=A0A934R772_9BACT|nr:hypothetical protein [Luteolibacter yonseiensis]MBK1818249.1 hypothetical protein [Luteolibacter yonseiensis]